MTDQSKDDRILRVEDVVVDWIYLAQDRFQWFYLVDTVMNSLSLRKAANLSDERLLASP